VVERPISPAHTARHYLGWGADIPARLAEHAAGGGAGGNGAGGNGAGAAGEGTWEFLFGRRTYEQFASFSPHQPLAF
jgi:hypothetical protein